MVLFLLIFMPIYSILYECGIMDWLNNVKISTVVTKNVLPKKLSAIVRVPGVAVSEQGLAYHFVFFCLS